MRPIKFRAWDKRIEEMQEVVIINFDNNRVSMHPDYDYSARFDEIELMQYTGLKDKHGTEIYEGDIVKRHPLDRGLPIVWRWSGFDFLETTSFTLHPDMTRYEVIGNIHENPELLNIKQRGMKCIK